MIFKESFWDLVRLLQCRLAYTRDVGAAVESVDAIDLLGVVDGYPRAVRRIHQTALGVERLERLVQICSDRLDFVEALRQGFVLRVVLRVVRSSLVLNDIGHVLVHLDKLAWAWAVYPTGSRA